MLTIIFFISFFQQIDGKSYHFYFKNENDKNRVIQKTENNNILIIQNNNSQLANNDLDEEEIYESNDEEIIDDIDSDNQSKSESFFNNLKLKKAFTPIVQMRGYFKKGFFQDIFLENGLEKATELRNRLFLEFKYQKTESLKITLSAELIYDLSIERNENDNPYFIVNGENFDGYFEYRVDEAYIDRKIDNFFIKGGFQIFKLGENYGFSRSDIINPADYRDSIIPSIDKRKLGVLAIDSGFLSKYGSVEFIWIPIHQSVKVDLWGSDFALIQPSKSIDPTVISDISPISINGKQDIPLSESVSQSNIKSSSFAFNINSSFLEFNSSLLLYYGYQIMPEIEMDEQLKELFKNLISTDANRDSITSSMLELGQRYLLGEELFKSKYTRMFTTAFSASYPIFSTILKFDISYTPRKLYYTPIEDDFNPFYRSVLEYTIGSEYQFSGTRGVFDFELWGSKITNSKNSDKYWFDKENRVGLFSFIKYTTESDKWDFFGAALFDISFYDYLFTIRVTYKMIQNHLEIGYNHFGGDSDSPIGRYDKNDQFFIEYKYFF
ncbi:hypothetical protein JXR93_06245 [bacterium]|nr:hypothetical protein [bacterium]